VLAILIDQIRSLIHKKRRTLFWRTLFCKSQTQIHGINHQKALFDADLHKERRKTPIKLTQPGQNSMKQWSMSSLWPTTRRWWRGGIVKGWPVLGATSPLLVLLSLSFDRRWHGFMLRWCSPALSTKNRHSTAFAPCINGGALPLSQNTSFWSLYLTTTSWTFYFLVVLWR
jgi:hypothetical protein